jgi:hypothetical protein
VNKQLRDASEAERKQQTEQQGKQRNIQELTIAYQNLLAQEQALLAQIGRIENEKEAARRRWIQQGINNPHKQTYTDPGEANLPLLKGQ